MSQKDIADLSFGNNSAPPDIAFLATESTFIYASRLLATPASFRSNSNAMSLTALISPLPDIPQPAININAISLKARQPTGLVTNSNPRSTMSQQDIADLSFGNSVISNVVPHFEAEWSSSFERVSAPSEAIPIK